MTPSGYARSIRISVFWLTAVLIVVALYWLCLRFLFPGYFAPLSAFHVDFYDYAAAGVKPFYILLTRYSRPASFAVAKILVSAGFSVLLAGEIVIALSSVLFTLAVARRVFGLRPAWAVITLFALYTFVLFAHPEFYAVHRHDLAAECAYLFLMVSLLAWTSFVSHRRTSPPTFRLILIICAVLFATLSAFSKETYFVSALCLAAGLALSDRRNRRLHLSFLILLMVLDCCSYAWNRHAGWPPADVGSAAGDAYRISVAPLSLARTYYFYLSKLLNPALILFPVLGIVSVWRDRGRCVLGFAFLVAGLAAFLPHAILPNHLESEYSWLGAPLFLAPFLLVSQLRRSTRFAAVGLALAILIPVLAVVGPGGYEVSYKSSAERWFINEDRKGAAMVRSFRRLQEIPRPARVLVVGLEDAAVPWETGDFVRSEFGERILWEVILPESIEYRRSSALVDFPHASDVILANFNWIVRYNSAGELASISSAAAVSASEPRSLVIVPSLSPLLTDNRVRPDDPSALLAGARVAATWGLWADATNFLDEAKRAGASDESVAALSADIQAAVAKVAASTREATLISRPAHVVQPDGSGLGEVELFWSVSEGAAVEVHVGAPDGALFARSDGSGHGRTGKWVSNGMQFFLQDVSGGKPLNAQHTLAQVKVDVSR